VVRRVEVIDSRYIVLLLYYTSVALAVPVGHSQGQNKTTMGYLIKVQKVDRPTNRSYYLNFPVVLAEALELIKGEEWEWSVEDKNTLVLTRKNKKTRRKLRCA
jgi:hypothetical protein